MDLDLKYPALSDLRLHGRKRTPHFVWEYLDSGTGREITMQRNRAALDNVLMRPAILKGEIAPDFTTNFLGTEYAYPFGISPLGMAGLIWPGAEQTLAKYAKKTRIPYGLSTVATREPEEIGPLAGDMGWFQIYAPRDPEILRDMMRRGKAAGFKTLILTVDVPAHSRRERQRRANLSLPPKLTPSMLLQMAKCPDWTLRTLKNGTPRLRLLEGYAKTSTNLPSTEHAGHLIQTSPDWEFLARMRDEWDGNLIAKGVMEPEEALRLQAMGIDAVWVSNHGGRQFDGSLASIEALPSIRQAVGPDYPLIMDSGIAGGLDIMRALALGADFVMMGRAYYYALTALGPKGPAHLTHILHDDMTVNMGMLGTHTLGELGERLVAPKKT